MYLYTICSIWKLSFTINTKWSHPGQSIFNEVFFLKVVNLYITKSDSISLQKIFTWEEYDTTIWCKKFHNLENLENNVILYILIFIFAAKLLLKLERK